MARPHITSHIAGDGTTTYRFRLSYVDPATGQRRQPHFTYSTRRAAEKGWAVETARIAQQGPDAPQSDLLMRELLTEWLATKANRAESTRSHYEGLCRRYIAPRLGHHHARALLPSHVTELQLALRAQGLAEQTVYLTHTALRQALDYALRDGVVPRNVAVVAGAPHRERHERPVWTRAQTRAYLAVAAEHGRYGPIWEVLLGTGMRRGEALGLRWRDVDWAARTLTVAQGVTAARGGASAGKLKTPGSGRRVKVDPSIMAALRAHQAQQAEHALLLGATWQDHDLLFPRTSGRPLHPANLRDEYITLCALAGVPRTHIHDSRHTHATVALEAGATMAAVSRRLGHKKVSTTMDIYAHVTQSMEDEAEEAVSKALFGLVVVPPDGKETGSRAG